MLPFGRVALKGQKFKLFPNPPKTLGEHLRQRRHVLGLLQREAANQLGISHHTVTEWEKDHSKPEARYWPNIIAFLGGDPCPEPRTLGERLQAKYRELGLSRKAAARRLQMDENTLERYERGASTPTTEKLRRALEAFLGAPV